MNIPQFWAKGKSGSFSCWRWSTQSLADAQALADKAAAEIAARFADGGSIVDWQGYYTARPAREQVLQELKNDAGDVTALITRNAHGCQVLNAARVMFVDVDFRKAQKPSLFGKLFGSKQPILPDITEESTLEKAGAWLREHPDWGWRIYRTRAGMRLMATHALMEPDSEMTLQVFEALESDPLYKRLCLAQKCFRARLTPKPWRCGIRTKPDQWPFLDPKAETHFKRWDAQYQSFAFNWATCQLVKQIGNPAVHPEIETILKLHDGATRVESKLQLA